MHDIFEQGNEYMDGGAVFDVVYIDFSVSLDLHFTVDNLDNKNMYVRWLFIDTIILSEPISRLWELGFLLIPVQLDP